jgi:hypothetical protein
VPRLATSEAVRGHVSAHITSRLLGGSRGNVLGRTFGNALFDVRRIAVPATRARRKIGWISGPQEMPSIFKTARMCRVSTQITDKPVSASIATAAQFRHQPEAQHPKSSAIHKNAGRPSLPPKAAGLSSTCVSALGRKEPFREFSIRSMGRPKLAVSTDCPLAYSFAPRNLAHTQCVRLC